MFDVYEKIKSVVELLAQKEKLSFEDAYLAFAESPVYEAMQNTETILWYVFYRILFRFQAGLPLSPFQSKSVRSNVIKY